MPFAVALYMDDATESLIHGVWERLAQRGADRQLKRGGRPHVALSVFEDCDSGDVATAIRRYSLDQSPLEARFEHLGTYGGSEGILFLVPVVSPRFFLLHSNVFKILNPLITGLKDGCRPNRYVPHCTIAHGLDKETLSRTVALFSNKALPIVGTFNRIGLVDLVSNEDRCIYPFAKQVVPS